MGAAEVERILQGIGARNHGVATRRQLLDGGLPVHTVDRLVRSGRLIVLHRGLYQIGPLPAARAREAAAVLAGGPSSRISHRSAAAIHTLVDSRGVPTPTDVTVPRNRRPRLRHIDVRIHRCRDLRPDEVTTFEGIPVTTPARTLLDLGECLTVRELEQSLATALRRGLVTMDQMRDMVGRHPKHRGGAPLRLLIESEAEPAFTRSEAEERLLQLTRDAGLPRPELNARIMEHEVDFLWRRQRAVAEVDGYAYHSSRGSFAADRRRDAELTAAGYRIVRFTWSDVTERGLATVARLAQILTR